MIIDHIGLVISDYAKSKNFYRQCLEPLGISLQIEVEGWAGFGRDGKAELWFGPGGDAHAAARQCLFQGDIAALIGDNGELRAEPACLFREGADIAVCCQSPDREASGRALYQVDRTAANRTGGPKDRHRLWCVLGPGRNHSHG